MSFESAVEHWRQGRLAQAESACRQVLAALPSHVPALHLLAQIALRTAHAPQAVSLLREAARLLPGNGALACDLAQALAQEGSVAEAEDQFDDATRRDGALETARFSFAVVLHQHGHLRAAITQYRRVLEHAPQHAEARSNLGAALLASGDAPGALQVLRDLTQDTAAASHASFFFNLGNAERACGLSPEAIGSYQRALALDPRFTPALDNLGVAHLENGDPDRAAACFQQVLAVEPLSAPTWSQLGLAQLALGLGPQALASARRGVTLEATQETTSAFVQCVQTQSFSTHDADLEGLLVRALLTPWCRPVEIVRAALSLLRVHPVLAPALQFNADAGPLPSDPSQWTPALQSATTHPLLLAILRASPVCDWDLECWLAAMRKALLAHALRNFRTAGTASGAGDPLPFWCALAAQCFIQGYVMVVDDAEAQDAAALDTALAQWIATGHIPPACAIAAAGAYAPLHRIAGLAQLARDAWPAPLLDLLRTQVDEPMRERALRESIPAFTPINNAISRLVRAQYETDPYPVWIRPAPVGPALPLPAHVRRTCPRAPLREPAPGQTTEVLVAGCGTGQHPLETARQIEHARVLALDLSLSSLAYARRKAEELGVTNVTFAQGDIASLHAVDRRFDVIESVGVLHHMEDPSLGWRNLLGLLKPDGVMRIGLYSRAARRSIDELRRLIGQGGVQDAAQIRAWRHRLANGELGPELAARIMAFPDFYTMAECRDLLFHVQEHLITLPELKALLAAQGLAFLGFTVDPQIAHAYQREFPGDATLTNLDHWHAFETAHPETFAGMYQFWVQRVRP